jgi:hypothetical protein
MNISDDRHRRLYVYDIALLHKQFLRLSAHRFDDRVGKELLAVQAFDTFVQIYAGYGTMSARCQVCGRPGCPPRTR